MFKDMSDWCMAKDYNGAERFSDGSRPLIAETKFADIIICGNTGCANDVGISVHPFCDHCYYFSGNTGTKELALQIGSEIVRYIIANGEQPFVDGRFREFFAGLHIADIRNHITD